jgi:hypothetical protein
MDGDKLASFAPRYSAIKCLDLSHTPKLFIHSYDIVLLFLVFVLLDVRNYLFNLGSVKQVNIYFEPRMTRSHAIRSFKDLCLNYFKSYKFSTGVFQVSGAPTATFKQVPKNLSMFNLCTLKILPTRGAIQKYLFPGGTLYL